MMTEDAQYLFHRANRLTAIATHKGDVLVEVDMPDAGLMPNVRAAFVMLPDEARQVAELLLQAAAEAERPQTQ